MLHRRFWAGTLAALCLGTALAASGTGAAHAADTPPAPPEKPGWNLVLQEEFNDPVLDPAKFSDSYLPHWTTYGQSLARYDVTDGVLSLKIEKEGQGPWWHGSDVQKVSSIQTGMRDGMHLFWDSCYITGHHRAVTNFETQYGYFELRARVPRDGGLHSAWWMIGNEERAGRNAEIDIFEICGPDCKSAKSRVRVSVHPWDDKALSEQSLDHYPACDVSQDFHVYGFEWLPTGMKFYFDGRLVKETSQSPAYPMTTFLGIYENNAPLWSGTIDPNGIYPKRFEVDYFRVYKTDEMLAAEAAAAAAPAPGQNLAPVAVAGAAQDWSWASPPSSMIDNNAYSAMQSQDAPSFPQYLYLDWQDTQTFDTFVLKAAYGQGQAPTNWELEVSADGSTGWTPVASSGDVAWNGSDWHVEARTLTFPPVQGKALRVKINSANLQWKHYAINEVLVFNSAARPVNVNLACEATPELDSANGGLLTDADRRTAAQGRDRPSFPQEITLAWPRAVAFNQVQLHCWHAQDQAPTSVSFEVSADGRSWTEAVPQTALNWQTAGETVERQTFHFAGVQDVRYLRMKVYGANLKWKHFAINELEVYDAV